MYYLIIDYENSFCTINNKPTRNNNIIYLFFTNEKQLLSYINIGDYFGLYKNKSDHYSVSFNINIEKYPEHINLNMLKKPLYRSYYRPHKGVTNTLLQTP